MLQNKVLDIFFTNNFQLSFTICEQIDFVSNQQYNKIKNLINKS